MFLILFCEETVLDLTIFLFICLLLEILSLKSVFNVVTRQAAFSAEIFSYSHFTKIFVLMKIFRNGYYLYKFKTIYLKQ